MPVLGEAADARELMHQCIGEVPVPGFHFRKVMYPGPPARLGLGTEDGSAGADTHNAGGRGVTESFLTLPGKSPPQRPFFEGGTPSFIKGTPCSFFLASSRPIFWPHQS